jgi:hypothetical protein
VYSYHILRPQHEKQDQREGANTLQRMALEGEGSRAHVHNLASITAGSVNDHLDDAMEEDDQ